MISKTLNIDTIKKLATTNRREYVKSRSQIVLVDENTPERREIKAILVKAGCTVTDIDAPGEKIVHTLKHNLICASQQRAEPFDAIILRENIIGQLDSFQAIYRIRQIGFKGLIVVASRNADDGIKFKKSGADAVVNFPPKKNDILRILGGDSAVLAPSMNDSSKQSSPPQMEASDSRIDSIRKDLFGDLESMQLKELRILYVEDSLTCLQINGQVLTESGHTIVEADSGYVAMNMVKNMMLSRTYGSKVGYDIIIVSALSTGISGPATVRNIRELGFMGPIFGLMETSNSGNAMRSQYIEVGVDAVLIKPLRREDFLRVLIGFCFPVHKESDSVQRPTTSGSSHDQSHNHVPSRHDSVHSSSHSTGHSVHPMLNAIVADDSLSACMLIGTILTSDGHSVSHATSALELIGLIKQATILDSSHTGKSNGYDLVIMSHGISKSTGPQTAQRLRDIGFDGMILGIVDSQSSTGAETFLQSGATSTAAKPLTHEVIKQSLIDMKHTLSRAKANMTVRVHTGTARHQDYDGGHAGDRSGRREPSDDLGHRRALLPPGDELDETRDASATMRTGSSLGSVATLSRDRDLLVGMESSRSSVSVSQMSQSSSASSWRRKTRRPLVLLPSTASDRPMVETVFPKYQQKVPYDETAYNRAATACRPTRSLDSSILADVVSTIDLIGSHSSPDTNAHKREKNAKEEATHRLVLDAMSHCLTVLPANTKLEQYDLRKIVTFVSAVGDTAFAVAAQSSSEKTSAAKSYLTAAQALSTSDQLVSPATSYNNTSSRDLLPLPPLVTTIQPLPPGKSLRPPMKSSGLSMIKLDSIGNALAGRLDSSSSQSRFHAPMNLTQPLKYSEQSSPKKLQPIPPDVLQKQLSEIDRQNFLRQQKRVVTAAADKGRIPLSPISAPSNKTSTRHL